MKNKKITRQKQNKYGMILLPLLITLLMGGGLYSYGVYLTGSVITVLLIIILQTNKKAQCVKTELFAGSIMLPALALITVFCGIDKGMAWTGFLRVLAFSIWIYYLMQFEKSERDQAFFALPFLGVAMTGVGILALMIPGLKEMFWTAGRFGGFFQYSNTCALFLIICIMITVENERPDMKRLLLFDALLMGTFLTGSKGGVLLLIPVLIWIFVKKKPFRKNGIFVTGFLVIGGIIYAMISGDFQNIARIYTILKYPSTLFGRLLYMKDALPVILKNPLGIGYLGYESIQPVIQTGVYTSKFVHNDWMQMTLDFGWLFVIVAAWIVIRQLKKGKQEVFKKIILCIIGLYSVGEFHLQFFFIVMTAGLLWDYNEDKLEIKKKASMRENQIFAVAAVVLFAYFAIASFSTQSGNYQRALQMFPYDTTALEGVLVVQEDKSAAEMMALELTEMNEYNSQGYNTLAYIALMDGEYEAALDYKLKVLSIERFNMNEYADFENMVKTIEEQAGGDEEIVKLCKLGIQEMNDLLEETKESVSPLAYKLRDKPEFAWD